MRDLLRMDHYSVFEINGIMETLSEHYDLVRLVDVEECRVLKVTPDGAIHYEASCFGIWGRKNRCADCTSKRACMTNCETDKMEHLGHDREQIHSIPIYLAQVNGEEKVCVIECVNYNGTENADFVETAPEEYIETHDMLTRLYTQELLFREMRQHLMDNPDTPYLVLLGNIRSFSVINKLFGMEAGNRLLIRVADILRAECTAEEVYGRFQDDRFVILIPREKFKEEVFLRHFESLKEEIESPVFTLSIKLGVYEVETRDMPVSAMIEHADVAAESIHDSMQESIAWYAPGMIEEKVRNQHIIADFEKALQDGEFCIYLQPQVDRDGKVFGGEALVRWQRPDGSLTPPMDFLPVLRQTELLSNLDLYVWEQAVALLSKWQNTKLHDQYISINVDPSDFYYVDVPKVLSDLCKKYSVDPEQRTGLIS